ncbi:DNA-binding protein [Ignisphaera sp. 4213-co]|uniref:DNA-binding protein n=1 Tax=Ignisphaera cupida TaxID=3050454 RepID=A0ABD4Z6N2_9CREN|nr:DNA-binding protein [Ignisphaera sp. 4213-co]MDK6028573.1 DNA-binding protein [Ignisphaera sp. 4213-co]
MSTAPTGNTKTIVLGNRPLREYVLEAIVSLNREADVIEILGRGRHIHRAVTLYNTLASRLGDRVTLKNVEIGSLLIKGRRVSYIKISIAKK